jgi:hypothetical protein
MLYLEPEVLSWAESSAIAGNEEDETEATVDNNGAKLHLLSLRCNKFCSVLIKWLIKEKYRAYYRFFSIAIAKIM